MNNRSGFNNIKDKMFTLQIWQGIEVIAGLITAPVIAYGVSNTLAMCFPEAAGWIRVSGLRFSPVFLTLGSILIMCAFFAFTSAFTNSRKIQASNVLKQDGFSNEFQHGVEIYGLEGTQKLEREKRIFFTIGTIILFIEFTMNVSYFMQENGNDLQGMFVSAIAALVATATLLTETFLTSRTQFEAYACGGVVEKID